MLCEHTSDCAANKQATQRCKCSDTILIVHINNWTKRKKLRNRPKIQEPAMVEGVEKAFQKLEAIPSQAEQGEANPDEAEGSRAKQSRGKPS